MPFSVTTPAPSWEGSGKGLILIKDGIEWGCDVNPLCTFGQQWGDYLMVALTAREYLAVFDDFLYFWWKPRLWIIGYSYDDES